jgi:hypothetical protein
LSCSFLVNIHTLSKKVNQNDFNFLNTNHINIFC